ncbi:FHA domain-containing protein [Streptomyces sp. CA-181903]|uniref:FHA domain-containing protein n=1 Tax=Streptomyces sp. CA-181903 TaxID=3240055 RepID=UPI003D905299
MQIRLTVLGPSLGGHAAHACDVLVTAPAGTALAGVTSGLAAVLAAAGSDLGTGAVTVYAGTERLDAQRCALGEPPLIDGAVLSLGAPADPERHPTTPLALLAETTARLHVVSGPDAGGVHLLHGGEVRIGRSSTADIPVDDPDVSRLHCAVTLGDDGRVTLHDLGSTNGTTLDATPVDERPVPFRPGALLRAGESTLVLHGPDGTDGRSATSVPATGATTEGPGSPLLLPTSPDGEGHLRVTPRAHRPTTVTRTDVPGPRDADAGRRPDGRAAGGASSANGTAGGAPAHAPSRDGAGSGPAGRSTPVTPDGRSAASGTDGRGSGQGRAETPDRRTARSAETAATARAAGAYGTHGLPHGGTGSAPAAPDGRPAASGAEAPGDTQGHAEAPGRTARAAGTAGGTAFAGAGSAESRPDLRSGTTGSRSFQDDHGPGRAQPSGTTTTPHAAEPAPVVRPAGDAARAGQHHGSGHSPEAADVPSAGQTRAHGPRSGAAAPRTRGLSGREGAAVEARAAGSGPSQADAAADGVPESGASRAGRVPAHRPASASPGTNHTSRSSDADGSATAGSPQHRAPSTTGTHASPKTRRRCPPVPTRPPPAPARTRAPGREPVVSRRPRPGTTRRPEPWTVGRRARPALRTARSTARTAAGWRETPSGPRPPGSSGVPGRESPRRRCIRPRAGHAVRVTERRPCRTRPGTACRRRTPGPPPGTPRTRRRAPPRPAPTAPSWTTGRPARPPARAQKTVPRAPTDRRPAARRSRTRPPPRPPVSPPTAAERRVRTARQRTGPPPDAAVNRRRAAPG